MPEIEVLKRIPLAILPPGAISTGAMTGEPTFRICHLSDLHVRCDSRGRRRDLESLAQAVEAIDCDHLVITGDLTDSGRDEEFELFAQVFGRLLAGGRATVIPGNHDIHNWPLTDRRGDLRFWHRAQVEAVLRELDPTLLPEPARAGRNPGVLRAGEAPRSRSAGALRATARWAPVALGGAAALLLLASGRGAAAVRTLVAAGILGVRDTAKGLAGRPTGEAADFTPDGRPALFPFAKRLRGAGGHEIMLIAIDTTRTGNQGIATNGRGAVGTGQLARLDALLAGLPAALPRVAICHHHLRPCPYPRLMKERFLAMRDASALEALLRRHRVQLVLHGHHHSGWREDCGGLTTIGAPSSTRGDVSWRASGVPRRYFDLIAVTDGQVAVEPVVLED